MASLEKSSGGCGWVGEAVVFTVAVRKGLGNPGDKKNLWGRMNVLV